jgi:hypothetical protein
MDMSSMADVNEAAEMIRTYLSNPDRAPELRMIISTGVLQADVVTKGKTLCVGARHFVEQAMDIRSVIGEMVQYGQATVGGFEDDSCTLTVHADLRYFIGMQRHRAVRAMQQLCASGTLGDRSVPSILLSKGMFATGSSIAPLSAHDTAWRTYHPALYKKGDMSTEFGAVAMAELEPLVMVNKYALVCSADLTRLHVHPTTECLLSKILFEVVLDNGRTVNARAVTKNRITYLDVKGNVCTVYAYGGPGGRTQVEMEQNRIGTETVLGIVAMDDAFRGCVQ